MALVNHSKSSIAREVCLLLISLFGCKQPKLAETKTLDLGEFQITVPSTWEPVKEKGIDSFVGRIALTSGDTISFDLGWYSNPLEEEVSYKVEETNVYLLNSSESTPNSLMYEFYGKRDTVDLDKFHKNKITWSTVDGRKAKIIEAKEPGDGMTGIYIDSVWRAGSGIDRFQMNGNDLTPENQQKLLAAFQTLKFSIITPLLHWTIIFLAFGRTVKVQTHLSQSIKTQSILLNRHGVESMTSMATRLS